MHAQAASDARDVSDDPQDHALIHTLGYAGLIPPVMLAALLWLVDAELQAWVAIGLASYVALILSFLGGIHWGIGWSRKGGAGTAAHSQRAHFIWGVAPSLLAWPGLLMPAYAGLAWLGLLLLVCYGVDRRLYTRAGLQRWLTLRFRLSAVAALSCFIAAGAI
jgi:hypothetical protein